MLLVEFCAMANFFQTVCLKETKCWLCSLLYKQHYSSFGPGDAGAPLLLMPHNNPSDGDVTLLPIVAEISLLQ